tara:strand:+ start:2306 stop:2632 length:327 start_codon:yes stop_codon:yes gene_type:complete
MAPVVLKSNCKVNIGLKIVSQRPDGYHTIHTLFQELDFHDTIILKKRDSGCQFSSNVNWLRNDTSNLCVNAWEKMRPYMTLADYPLNWRKKFQPAEDWEAVHPMRLQC